MRVDLFINSLRGGGAERVCTTIANGLVEQGHDVRLIVLNLKNAVYDKDLDKKVRIINLQKKHARGSFFVLASYLSREKPKKLLVFNHQLAVLLVILRKLLAVPCKIFARNINTLSLQRLYQKSLWHKYVVHILVKFFYRRVDFLIAQSVGMKEDLLQHYGFNPQKIEVIYNPVSQSIVNKSPYLDKKKNKEIYYIGKLTPQKGLHFLINSFTECIEKCPDLTLNVVGDGPLRSELESLVLTLGLEKKVIFRGFTKDIVSCYSKASVVVLTSLYEGFPNVLVESISVGTPVVSFDCPSGPKEIILDDVNGYLVPTGDIEYLTNKMLQAINKEWDREKIIQTAKRFSSEKIIKQYVNILENF